MECLHLDKVDVNRYIAFKLETFFNENVSYWKVDNQCKEFQAIPLRPAEKAKHKHLPPSVTAPANWSVQSARLVGTQQ